MSEVKLTIISDTHNQHNQLVIPDGDILIHCGDFSSRGSQKEFDNFIIWFKEQPHEYKILVAGNHDIYLECRNEQISSKLLKDNIFYLENEPVLLHGIWFHGFLYTPTFGDWAFMSNRPEMNKQLKKIHKNTDVLICHGMPYGIMDIAPRINTSVGCKDLLDTVDTIKPKLVCGGHLHSGYGEEVTEDTLFVNASVCNEQYIPSNKPQVVYFDTETQNCWSEI